MNKFVWIDEIDRTKIKGLSIPNRITVFQYSNVGKPINQSNTYVNINNEIIGNEDDFCRIMLNKHENLLKSIFYVGDSGAIVFQSMDILQTFVALADCIGIDYSNITFCNIGNRVSGFQTDNRIAAKLYKKRCEKLNSIFNGINPLDFKVSKIEAQSTKFKNFRKTTDNIGTGMSIVEWKGTANGENQEKVETNQDTVQEQTPISNESKPKFGIGDILKNNTEGITKFALNTKNNTIHRLDGKCAARIKNTEVKEVNIEELNNFEDVKICKRCLKAIALEEAPETEEDIDAVEEKIEKDIIKENNSNNNEKVFVGDYSIIAKQIEKLCNKFGICGVIVGQTLRVVTASGSWYFNYVNRPIKIYHLNYANKNNSKANIEYHKQSIMADSPVDALAYIIKHDNARIERLLEEALKK